ncbi:MAG: phosphoribosylglycinamide formyltransferase [Planctomycetota bacterium]
MKKQDPLRLAVLVSGGGTGLQNLIDRIHSGRLPGVEICVVISSKDDAPAVQRAEQADLPVDVIRAKDFTDVDKFSEHIVLTLDVYDADLVVQAGWLCYWKLPARWLGKTINIHPALLPKFGGKGFYGRHVHEAVLAAGETQSGATVHWVDNEYDHGAIIRQKACPVQPGDTPETLAARVQAVEFDLLTNIIGELRDQRRGGKW